MSIRFRKRIKLAPGIHLNLSGGGLSLSAGPRGASMTFGSRGTYLNAGIPGSGLYTRKRIDTSQRNNLTRDKTFEMTIKISVDSEGVVIFHDQDGNLLPESIIKLTKEQHKDKIYDVMESECDEINGHIEALEQIHFATPAPDEHPIYTPCPYDTPPPAKPTPRKHGIMGTLFSSIGARIDLENQTSLSTYQKALLAWERQQRKHDTKELEHKSLIEDRVLREVPAMEAVLEESLNDIVWPRETSLTYDIENEGNEVMIDINLPEIEELPKKIAAMPARGYKLSLKELSTTRVQQLYMRHVHGVGFRIIGEIFSVLPKAKEIVLSGYSQRADKATGSIQNQYLYSVKVNRNDWAKINFKNLSEVDTVEALGLFDIRREITKSGIFKAIVPFDRPSSF